MRVLLDQQGPDDLRQAVKAAIESRDGNRVCDLHLWSIGPGIFACAISIVTGALNRPKNTNA
jgi:Co/Zn/Cd efflux system component